MTILFSADYKQKTDLESIFSLQNEKVLSRINLIVVKNILAFYLIFFNSIYAIDLIPKEGREDLIVEGKRLTPFWATEYIGADLIKKELKKREDAQRVPFSIFDVGFEADFINNPLGVDVSLSFNGNRRVIGHHGTSVANIINGDGLQSVSEVVDYVQLKNVSPAIFYHSAVRETRNLPTRPWIISNSVGWSDERIKDLAVEMDELGIIWFLAAGNQHPKKIPDHESRAPVILVGSYSPLGLQSLSSQESETLLVLAPSDAYLASTDGLGEKGLFGATSGATPLVSGIIANLKSLIPSLTRTQVRTLIEKTSIKSFHQTYNEYNQAGLLNGYKLYRSVVEIKNRCESDENCIQYQIDSFDILRVVSKREHLEAQDFCTQSSDFLSSRSLNSLREDFFLFPNDPEIPLILSCVYQRLGYDANASFYKNVYLIYHDRESLKKRVSQMAVNAIENDYWQSSSLRDVELFSSDVIDSLEWAIETNQGIGSFKARRYLERYHESYEDDFLQ